MKPKTLKDFEEEDLAKVNNLSTGNYEGLRYFEGRQSLFSELKAEAIKWVKDFRKRSDEIWECDFMKFHNITEDDLI